MPGEVEVRSTPIEKLGDHGAFSRGRGGTKADGRTHGAPCVRYGDLYTRHDSIIRDFASFIDPAAAPRYTPLQCGDVVFAASGETHAEIGKGAAYCGSDVAYASADTIIFRPKAHVDPRFIGYSVNTPEAARFKAKFGQGSSVIHISASHLERLPLFLPVLPEQRRIAAILDTLDEAILRTEQVIGKLKQMKQGLLHDLLTRGIDDNGELRPPPDEAPHFYKDSPLGRIPRGWAATELESAVDERRPVVYGILMPGYGHPGGVPVVKVKDIQAGEIKTDDLLLTSPSIDHEYRRSRLLEGDLLFTIRGTVGRVAFVPPGLSGANITQDTARLAIQGMSPVFVQQYLQMPVPRRFIDVHTVGQAVKGLNLRDLRRVPVAVPPEGEQRFIAHELSTADDRVREESEGARKLRTLKHGLMDDLLTGRVRVSNPAEELHA